MYVSEVTKVKRAYDSTRRRTQAEATRRDVIDAAGSLFAAQGYAATTIDEIAAEAGVSRETIFKSFATKRELLRLWAERQVAGPDEPVPIRQQTWMDDLRHTTDQRHKLALAVAAVRRIHDRAIDALEVVRSAAHADPQIADLWDDVRRRRRRDVTAVVQQLTAAGPTNPDLSPKELIDVTYALSSSELYDLLVRQCRWRPARFERWLNESLDQLTLGQREGERRGPDAR
jgi:AcrR family transcriptional regulator